MFKLIIKILGTKSTNNNYQYKFRGNIYEL